MWRWGWGQGFLVSHSPWRLLELLRLSDSHSWAYFISHSPHLLPDTWMCVCVCVCVCARVRALCLNGAELEQYAGYFVLSVWPSLCLNTLASTSLIPPASCKTILSFPCSLFHCPSITLAGWYSVLEGAIYSWSSLTAQLVKNLPAMQETPVRFLRWEDPLEKG